MNIKFLFFLIISSVSFAQTDSLDKPFVKLKTGQMLYGKNVEYQNKVMNKKVILDGKEFPASTVMFYNTGENALFGNTSNVPIMFNKSYFYSKGAHFFVLGGGTTFTEGGYTNQAGDRMGGTKTSSAKLYFTHNLGKIKKVSATSLKHLFKTDSVANNLIQKANVAKSVSNISLLAATGLLGLSIATSFSGNRLDRGTESGITILGSGCIIAGIIANTVKNRKTRAAVTKYYGLDLD